jgi:hypothetical protein
MKNLNSLRRQNTPLQSVLARQNSGMNEILLPDFPKMKTREKTQRSIRKRILTRPTFEMEETYQSEIS